MRRRWGDRIRGTPRRSQQAYARRAASRASPAALAAAGEGSNTARAATRWYRRWFRAPVARSCPCSTRAASRRWALRRGAFVAPTICSMEAPSGCLATAASTAPSRVVSGGLAIAPIVPHRNLLRQNFRLFHHMVTDVMAQRIRCAITRSARSADDDLRRQARAGQDHPRAAREDHPARFRDNRLPKRLDVNQTPRGP